MLLKSNYGRVLTHNTTHKSEVPNSFERGENTILVKRLALVLVDFDGDEIQ